MEHSKENHIGDTIRIRRPPRVITDELGRTSWMGEVDPVELELEQRMENTNPYDLNPSLEIMRSADQRERNLNRSSP